MTMTRRRPSKGRYRAWATARRTSSTVMAPPSPASTASTSECAPRAIRLQAEQRPQASSGRAGPEPDADGGDPRNGSVQLSAWASAVAASRFPTPSGPAKSRLGGSDARSTAREINCTSAR